MSGGLVQIVNYGNQDLTLTGKPEITFFTSLKQFAKIDARYNPYVDSIV